MDNNTILILGGLILVAIVVIIFGKRLGEFSLKFLGFGAKVKGTQKRGAKVTKVKNDGAQAQFRAEGEGAAIDDVESKGDGVTFIAKS